MSAAWVSLDDIFAEDRERIGAALDKRRPTAPYTPTAAWFVVPYSYHDLTLSPEDRRAYLSDEWLCA